jgi:predicted GIY-YIG superfamily endonuclease
VISKDSRTALYRLYAADGTLLYIGVTGKLLVRFGHHRHEKRWWPQVAGMRIAWYPDKAEAEEAERAAICSEDPVHNIRSTPRHGEVIIAARLRQGPCRIPENDGLLSGEPLLFGGESEEVRAHYRELIEHRLKAG